MVYAEIFGVWTKFLDKMRAKSKAEEVKISQIIFNRKKKVFIKIAGKNSVDDLSLQI